MTKVSFVAFGFRFTAGYNKKQQTNIQDNRLVKFVHMSQHAVSLHSSHFCILQGQLQAFYFVNPSVTQLSPHPLEPCL